MSLDRLDVFAHRFGHRLLGHHLFVLKAPCIASYLLLDVKYLSLSRCVVMIEEPDVSLDTGVDHIFLGTEGPVPITEVFASRSHTLAALCFVLLFHDIVDAALNLSSLLFQSKIVVVIRLVQVLTCKLPFESCHQSQLLLNFGLLLSIE